MALDELVECATLSLSEALRDIAVWVRLPRSQGDVSMGCCGGDADHDSLDPELASQVNGAVGSAPNSLENQR